MRTFQTASPFLGDQTLRSYAYIQSHRERQRHTPYSRTATCVCGFFQIVKATEATNTTAYQTNVNAVVSFPFHDAHKRGRSIQNVRIQENRTHFAKSAGFDATETKIAMFF